MPMKKRVDIKIWLIFVNLKHIERRPFTITNNAKMNFLLNLLTINKNTKEPITRPNPLIVPNIPKPLSFKFKDSFMFLEAELNKPVELLITFCLLVMGLLFSKNYFIICLCILLDMVYIFLSEKKNFDGILLRKKHVEESSK